MVPRRALGRTGIEVGVLGLGTVKFGRATGVRYPRGFDIPGDEAVRGLLRTAREVGINLIDTAPAYGVSEQRLGQLLVGERDAWVLSTKAGEEFDAATGTSRFDFTPEGIRRSVERSLARLRTDRLDIVLLHSDGDDASVLGPSGALDALHRLKEEGKARAIGASTKTPEGGLLACEGCDVVMLALNPIETADLPAVRRAAALGVGVLVKKALASGHVERLTASADDPVEASLRFVLQEPAVSSVVVGTINQEHLRSNAAAAARAMSDQTSAG